MTFADAIEQVLPSLPDQGDDGAKAGSPVVGGAEAVQQFLDIGRERLLLPRIAGAVDAGFAVECIYFQSGVFAETVFAGKPVNGGGFFLRVRFERIPGFGDIDGDTGF